MKLSLATFLKRSNFSGNLSNLRIGLADIFRVATPPKNPEYLRRKELS